MRRFPYPVLPAILLLAAAGSGSPGVASGKVAPVRPGDPFPASTHANLNPAGPETVDLSAVLGRKPVVLVYWIAGNERSERTFRQVEELAAELGPDRLALYGVAVPRPERGADAIRARVSELGLSSPVLDDEGFAIGRRLMVQSVPNIAVVGREGRLRLANGAGLTQEVQYKVDVAAVIRRAAGDGSMVTYGYLERYYPVRELEGKPSPDFAAPRISDSVEQRWSRLLDADKLNVLIFWSVDCPHCRKALPEINRWLERHGGTVNVVSAAHVDSDAARLKTRDFCELNAFRFPTLIDRDARIGDLFQVTSTPTVLVIRPDGVVDTAIVSGEADVVGLLERKQRELLKTAGS